jgi:hypothetical protein
MPRGGVPLPLFFPIFFFNKKNKIIINCFSSESRVRGGSPESRGRSGVARASPGGSLESRRRSGVEGPGRVGSPESGVRSPGGVGSRGSGASRESRRRSGVEGPSPGGSPESGVPGESGVGSRGSGASRESRGSLGGGFLALPASRGFLVPGQVGRSTPQEPVRRPGDRCGMRNGERGAEKKKSGKEPMGPACIPAVGAGTKKWMQHRDFPGGHPSQYYSGPKALNFRVLMGSGVVALV